MYMVVEIKDNEIVWKDNKVSDTKKSAQTRIDVFKKQAKYKQFSIIQLTGYKLVS